MDLKDAEKIEFDAMRQRYNRLLIYAAERKCDLAGLQQERIPSVEEMKKMAKDSKNTDKVSTDTDKTNVDALQAEVAKLRAELKESKSSPDKELER